MTIISLIAAIGENRELGKDNQLPWHLSADLKYFREQTKGKPVIMGRKTYESIGRPLPMRENIIISHNPDYKAEGCHSCTSLDKAISLAKSFSAEEVMVIGGGQIYTESLKFADRLYITEVHKSVDADAFFPDFDKNSWHEKSRIPQEENGTTFDFVIYEK